MSNALYNERRAAGLCGRCGGVANGAYCEDCRRHYREQRREDRAANREGYNQYMRVYNSLAPRCLR